VYIEGKFIVEKVPQLCYNDSEGVTITESKTEKSAIRDVEHDTPSANREIKDGVFKLLFEKPENAAELYYALTGIKCHPDEIQIITITTVVSGEMKNDLAFVVRDRVLFAGEHQSTPNKNMPIRILMYLGQLYEKWFRMEEEEGFLYSTGQLKIPKPEFAVFYNGIAKRPEKEILKLCEAFKDTSGISPDDNSLGLLKLEVPVYNINKGMNAELFSKGEKLRQYSEFVAKLREYQKAYDDFNKAANETVKYCMDNNILVDFLRENGGKIVSILTAEYNAETHRRVYAREYHEEKMIETAKKLLRLGTPIEVVIEGTNLDAETVRQIKADLDNK